MHGSAHGIHQYRGGSGSKILYDQLIGHRIGHTCRSISATSISDRPTIKVDRAGQAAHPIAIALAILVLYRACH